MIASPTMTLPPGHFASCRTVMDRDLAQKSSKVAAQFLIEDAIRSSPYPRGFARLGRIDINGAAESDRAHWPR